MNSKFIHVERIIRKINYLYETIEANPLQSTNLEIALLRQYAVDLYDSILAMEAEQNDELNISKQVMEDLRSERARVADQMRTDVGVADMPEDEVHPEIVGEEEAPVSLEEPEEQLAVEEDEVEEVEAEAESEEEDRILDKEILAAAIGAGGALSVSSLLGQDSEEVAEDNSEAVEENEPEEFVAELPEPVAEEPSFEPEPIELPDFDTPDTFPGLADDKMTEVMPEGLLSTLSSNGIESTGDSLEDEARTEVLTDLVAKLREKENAAESLMREAVDEPSAIEETPAPPTVEEFLADPEPEPEPVAQVAEPVAEDEPESVNDLLSQQESKPLGESLSYNSGNRFGINFNQRYSYIENLFNDNANEYDGTIAELSKCSNVIEAFTYLNLNVKNKYRWRKDDPISEEFLNQIKETFLSED